MYSQGGSSFNRDQPFKDGPVKFYPLWKDDPHLVAQLDRFGSGDRSNEQIRSTNLVVPAILQRALLGKFKFSIVARSSEKTMKHEPPVIDRFPSLHPRTVQISLCQDSDKASRQTAAKTRKF